MRVRTIGPIALACVWLFGASAAASQTASKKETTKHESTKHGEQAFMLKQDMRKLWTDHVVWTRGYIIAALADAPDAPSALNRLMKSQEDIGDAVAQLYGDAAGQQLE